MAAAALGISPELVELDMSDTSTSGNSGSTSASRLTFMAGNSIREAANWPFPNGQMRIDRPSATPPIMPRPQNHTTMTPAGPCPTSPTAM
ncbi:MAG: molybdopterin cofactor-binding domain-containing protein [Chloroflexota bacterium]